jgi:hypothetical protein
MSVFKASDLLHCEVVGEDGARVGHVRDIRVVRDGDPLVPDGAPPYRVEGLVVGRRGVIVRLGLRAHGPEAVGSGDLVRWEDVVAMEPGRLVVRRR